MAKPRDKKTGKPAGMAGVKRAGTAGEGPAGQSGRPRGAGAQAPGVSERRGFEETPQASFEGAPVDLKGPVSSWIEQLEGEASTVSNDEINARAARAEETRRIRSEAGKHRLKAAKGGAGAQASGAGASKVGDKKSSRGTLIGGTSDPKRRAEAGLMPVSGLDVSLEDAGNIAAAGVSATLTALEDLMRAGDPNIREWVPHRPPRPEKSEGGIELKMVTDFKPSGDQPTAIRDLVEGLADQVADAGAARRHRLGQDLHHGQGDRGHAAPGA